MRRYPTHNEVMTFALNRPHTAPAVCRAAAVMIRNGRAFPGPGFNDRAYTLAGRLATSAIVRALGWRPGHIPG